MIETLFQSFGTDAKILHIQTIIIGKFRMLDSFKKSQCIIFAGTFRATRFSPAVPPLHVRCSRAAAAAAAARTCLLDLGSSQKKKHEWKKELRAIKLKY